MSLKRKTAHKDDLSILKYARDVEQEQSLQCVHLGHLTKDEAHQMVRKLGKIDEAGEANAKLLDNLAPYDSYDEKSGENSVDITMRDIVISKHTQDTMTQIQILMYILVILMVIHMTTIAKVEEFWKFCSNTFHSCIAPGFFEISDFVYSKISV